MSILRVEKFCCLQVIFVGAKLPIRLNLEKLAKIPCQFSPEDILIEHILDEIYRPVYYILNMTNRYNIERLSNMFGELVRQSLVLLPVG